MSKNVYVGMSGGVDSSLTAAKLAEQDYNVVGVFMKNWTKDVLGFECPWWEDLTDAKSVAAQLNIPLKVYDFQTEYKQKVVDYMIEGYRQGYTPNPDVMCNQEIKFKLFLQTALEDGADLIATGHYARIDKDKPEGESSQATLFRGVDENKDQSYFLYRVTETALSRSLMPLGQLTKEEVRKEAMERNLATAEKSDSQGICFIGEVDLKDFLRQYIQTKAGPIKDKKGEVLGEHDGVYFYTIGQRHGLGLGGGLPYYVVAKDVEANTLYVTADPADLDLNRDEFVISEAHWINTEPNLNKDYEVQTRYRGKTHICRLESLAQNKYRVKMDTKERAITPGQSAVIYEGNRVLGGGIVEAVSSGTN